MNVGALTERLQLLARRALERHALLAQRAGRVYVVRLDGTVWDEEDVEYRVDRDAGTCTCGKIKCPHLLALLYGSDKHTWREYQRLNRKRKLPKGE